MNVSILASLQKIGRALTRGMRDSGEATAGPPTFIYASKRIIMEDGRPRLVKRRAVAGDSRASGHIFSDTLYYGGGKLGFSMLTVKDCDAAITWDSEGMAKAKPQQVFRTVPEIETFIERAE